MSPAPAPSPRIYELRIASKAKGARTIHRYARNADAAAQAARRLPSVLRVMTCEPVRPCDERKLFGLAKGGGL